MERVDKYLADIRILSTKNYEIVQRLREIILSSHTGIVEEVKYGGILFSSSSVFCGVFSHAHHVSLEFSEGAKLADSQRVLEGSGKHRRHIKLRDLNDIEAKHVHEYVRSALSGWRGAE